MDSKERREDGYTTEDDINLNAFFNEGPDLKIAEIEQSIYVDNVEYVDYIENNNLENTQVNPDIILPDQQVHKDVLRLARFYFNLYCSWRFKTHWKVLNYQK